MAALVEENRLGDILKWEEDNRYSREVEIVEAGQDLAIGTVVGKKTADGKVVQIDFSASDGSENAYGVLAANCDATDADTEAVVIVRDAIVAPSKLVWPDGATEAQKNTALDQLAARGIITREEA